MAQPNQRPCPRIRPWWSAVLLGLLSACGSSSYHLVFAVNPPEASVYVNGVPAGQGGRRPQTLSFDQQERVYVQATAPGYDPRIEWYLREQVVDMINRGLDLPLTLRQRR